MFTPRPFGLASNLIRRGREASGGRKGTSKSNNLVRRRMLKGNRRNRDALLERASRFSKEEGQKKRRKEKEEEPEIIDLVSSDSESNDVVLPLKKKSKRKKKKKSTPTPLAGKDQWECKGCSWVNSQRELNCGMCQGQRPIFEEKTIEPSSVGTKRKRKIVVQQPTQSASFQSKLVPKDDSFALRLKIDNLERKLASKDKLITELRKSVAILRAKTAGQRSSGGAFGMSSSSSSSSSASQKKKKKNRRPPQVYQGVADSALNDELLPIQGSLWEGVGIMGL